MVENFQNIKGRRILIIDDEADLILLMKETFQDFGAIVMDAKNGREGAAIIQSNAPFDLIISDMRMPHGGGDFVLKSLTPETKPKVFIIMSGFSDFPEEELIKLGAQQVITKPVQIEALLKQANEWMIAG